MAWTCERLEGVARGRLGGAKLVVVANREPYLHTFDGNEIRCVRPASGLTTALDPVMRACGGTWVAHGSGDADRLASDENGRVMVPPEHPAYTVRRVWLTKEEEQGYYYGELVNAVLINPYAIDDFAEALRLALVMSPEEQEQRMAHMPREIADNNVYRWAGMLLSEAAKLMRARQAAESRTPVEIPA
jgi:trehalose-6-phosphate synthase